MLLQKKISKSYGSNIVLNEINLSIDQGEKIAFVGRNGEGKTTLARIIMNEIDYSGEMNLGHNVKVGYFAQNQAQLLNEDITVFETIDEIAVGDIRTKIRDILAAFLFKGEDIDKKVKVLSGGEKSRLAMIRLMLEPVNFLILDEPTNHLDIQSKEILKNALINFSGTVLIVSHDREFLDGLVNCIYEFRNKNIKQHLGGIFDFLYRKKIESLQELEINTASKKSLNNRQKSKSHDTISFDRKKEISKNISRFEKKIKSTELKIESLELEITEMNIILSTQEKFNDMTVFEKYEKLKSMLEKAMKNWENELEELENWKTKKTW